MPLSDKAEEILETLWVEQVEKGREQVGVETLERSLHDHPMQDEQPPSASLESEEVKELLAAALVELGDKGELSLTPAGKEQGEHIVRNHRLAERLLTDVLDLPESLGDAAACQFEHVLKRGIDERICTLLGHPRSCPHGHIIPPGACCAEKRDTSIRVVAPLSELEEGATGSIAYLHTAERGQVERLLALGVLPGQPVTLIQRFPSYLFSVGQTQVAVDEELASQIYVRHRARSSRPKRRWRRGLGLR